MAHGIQLSRNVLLWCNISHPSIVLTSFFSTAITFLSSAITTSQVSLTCGTALCTLTEYNLPYMILPTLWQITESLTLKIDEILLGPENHHLHHLLYVNFELSYTLAVQIQTTLTQLVSSKPTKQCPKELNQKLSWSKSFSSYTKARYKLLFLGRNFSFNCARMTSVSNCTSQHQIASYLYYPVVFSISLTNSQILISQFQSPIVFSL